MKQKKRIVRDVSRTHDVVPSSPPTDMSYWLERISSGDIGQLWNDLGAYAKDAPGPTMSVRWESGTTLTTVFLGGVTASITPNGFVLTFTDWRM